MKEAMVEAIRREAEQEIDMPVPIMGDFNETPCTLDAVRKLIDE